MRTLATFAMVGLIGFGLVGCGGDAEKDTVDVTKPAELQMRVVDGSPMAPASGGAPAEMVQRLAAFECPTGEVEQPDPGEYALVCDSQGLAYLLAPASWTGSVEHAAASIPDKQVSWVVDIDLDDDATSVFAALSTELAGTGRQFAVVMNGRVFSAPTIEARITDGRMQFAGNFTEASANELADRLAGR